MLLRNVLLLVLLVFGLAPAYATEQINWVVFGALEVGGDKVGVVEFDDGESDSIKAGELLYVAGGLIIPISEVFETQLTFGYKTDTVSAENGDVSFDRFPMEALVFYRTEQWRFGGGLNYHLAPTLEGDGFASAADVDFDNALGITLEVDYALSENGFLGLRTTMIEYELSDFPGEDKVDGDSIGILIGLRDW